MGKKYDVVAIVGQYQDRQTGQMRPRHKNVGAVIEQSDGKQLLLLDKTFNPAGLAEKDRESILLSLFEPRDSQQAPQPAPQQPQQPAPQQGGEFNDDVPF